MTLAATTSRTRSIGHAYAVPVVREITPRRADRAAASTW
jgi:hypothetical protein